MKYIVFSFDDGMIDFKERALPILNKYNYKASVNVISGYSDKTIADRYDCLDVNDLKNLYNNKFELANHTNSHLKSASYQELQECNNKLNEWCSTLNKTYGIIMPKYVQPCADATKYIKINKPPYISFEKRMLKNYFNLFRCIKWKIASIFNPTFFNKMCYVMQVKMYKKGHVRCFRRVEVKNTIEPDLLFESLKTIKESYCITLCFHSITHDLHNCPYPKGAWTPEKFDKLCSLIHKDKNFNVITQIEAVLG